MAPAHTRERFCLTAMRWRNCAARMWKGPFRFPERPHSQKSRAGPRRAHRFFVKATELTPAPASNGEIGELGAFAQLGDQPIRLAPAAGPGLGAIVGIDELRRIGLAAPAAAE